MSKEITRSRLILQNQYAHLNGDGEYDSAPVMTDAVTKDNTANLNNPYAYINDRGVYASVNDLENVVTKVSKTKHHTGIRANHNNPYAYITDIDDIESTSQKLVANTRVNTSYTHKEIENIARNLQIKIWNNRNVIWPEGVPKNPVTMLDPDIAIKLIGYNFEVVDYLGDSKKQNNEIGGIIDRLSKRITISRRCKPQVRRFTAAHELGHACLHNDLTMHRDLPIDGSGPKRDGIEVDADKFATYFLMPEKLVRKEFMQVFGTCSFKLTEDTAYALNPSSSYELIKKCKTKRGLSRILASAEYYNGFHVKSLAGRFKVSVKTMAIRIEELKLFKF